MFVQGTTNVLPTIQGNTQVLPPITGDANTVLQDTAGLAGMVDENGFFGTTATTDDIFGNTINSEGGNYLAGTNTFQGTDTLGGNTTATFGTTETLPTIGAADPFLGNPTLMAGTQIIPSTTTDTNTIYGATAYTTPGVKQTTTTTTTKTTYNNVPGFGVPATTTFGTDPNLYGFQQNIQSEYQATGLTTPDSNIGYGTTAADFIAAQPTTYTTTTPIETTTTQTTTTTFDNTIPTPATTVTVEPQPIPTPIETIPQPVIQTQTVQPPPVVTPPPIVQQPIPPPVGQTTINRFGIIDEDFRRGRPIYNDIQGGGVKLLRLNNNNNLPVRPVYNVGINRNPQLIQPYAGVAIRNNNVPLGAGLDRLGRGGSYDVYGRGLNPLYNRVGLTPLNTNAQAAGNIKDFL